MQELAKIEELSADHAPAIFENKDGVRQIIDRLREEVKSVVPDVTTAKGRKEIASLAHKVARSKTTLDGLGKELVAGIKEKAKVIDASRKIARDELDALKAEVRKPLDDWESAEAARVEQHERGIAVIREYGQAGQFLDMDSELLKRNLAELEAIELGDHWEEFAAEAESVKAQSVINLTQRIAEAERREADQAELERLRKEAAEREEAERKAKAEQEQKERDERLQREAAERAVAEEKRKAEEAEKARIAAEQEKARQAAEAERQRIEDQARKDAEHKAAIERAEREKQEAIRKAEDAAEAERRRIAHEAEQKRLEDEARAADIEHRRTINNAAVASLVKSGISEDCAKSVVTAIAKGDVDHVKIQY
jgi:hypothetical protein